MPQKKLRALERMHMEWEMSRRKQAVPNTSDPISEAKRKMLERKVRRMRAETPEHWAEVESKARTPSVPDPDLLPVVIVQTDRPITPKDALGPEPGIVRQLVLGTAEWPRHIRVAKYKLSLYDQRHVRYHWEHGRLYFWLENGNAVYDVAETPDGLWLEGDLLCGVVFPPHPSTLTTPKE